MTEQDQDDLQVLAAVGRMYLDAIGADPRNEHLTLPDAIAVTLVREAVERQERANHPGASPLAYVRFTEDGHTEVYQRTGASVILPTGTWTRLERYP